MGLETATTLAELDQTWPTGVDPVNKGDDHLRLIKQVLKAQFPGDLGSGYDIPIAALEVDLNNCTGSASNFQDQIDALVSADALGTNPVGAVIMFNAVFANIPVNWQLCDGTNGTPDMTNNFVYGTNTEVELLDAGGSADAVVIDHNHPITDPGHNHTYNEAYDAANSASGSGDTEHFNRTGTTSTKVTGITVDSVGVSGVDLNLPPFIKLAYIQRMS